jgi:hypothetical protein
VLRVACVRRDLQTSDTACGAAGQLLVLRVLPHTLYKYVPERLQPWSIRSARWQGVFLFLLGVYMAAALQANMLAVLTLVGLHRQGTCKHTCVMQRGGEAVSAFTLLQHMQQASPWLIRGLPWLRPVSLGSLQYPHDEEYSPLSYMMERSCADAIRQLHACDGTHQHGPALYQTPSYAQFYCCCESAYERVYGLTRTAYN